MFTTTRTATNLLPCLSGFHENVSRKVALRNMLKFEMIIFIEKEKKCPNS
ncbi:MAG: hypothetical protein ACJAWV_000633 [Flammeovirgaceae bacterium]|jgi:hypothetical protein